MKILIINIAIRPASARKFFPIGLGYIVSAVKRAGYDFDLLDLDAHPMSTDETEKFLQENHYDVVMLGCIVTGYRYVKWICNVIKMAFPDTKVIVGNSVASSIPDVLLTKTAADIAVIGEGEITAVELLECIKEKQSISNVLGVQYMNGGQVIKTPPRPVIENIDSIGSIKWEIFDIEIYIESLSKAINEPLPPIPKGKIRAMPINTARGCPYSCSFCYHVFMGSKYRYRSAALIVEEMQFCHKQYGINYFTLNDELTFFSIKQANEFAETLLDCGLKVYWDADCRSGLFRKDEDVEVVRKLKQAGCMALSFSLESASTEILKWMNKKVGPEAFSRQCKILKNAGLASLTSIVIGYPNETKETIKETIDCCIANNVYPSAGYLLPQPLTPMYDYAIQNGYIKDEEEYLLRIGDRQDLHINMTKMSDEELTSVVDLELTRCSGELSIGLENGKLLKTGHYRIAKKEPSLKGKNEKATHI